MMRIAERRRGAIAVVVAISMVALLGVVAIVLDGGLLLDQRRQAQSAADAAALAAANDLFANYRTNQGVDVSGNAAKNATAYAALNGYNNDGTTNTVTVNIPPATGNYAGQAGYVEVVITTWQGRGFSSIFGGGALPVKARAVARGKYVAGKYGVVVLDPSSTDTLEINGTLNLIGSGVITVNSSDPAAVQLYNTGNVTANFINIVGYPGIQNNASPSNMFAVNATVNTGITAVADPLANIPEPTTSGLTSYGSKTCTGNVTINPGVYSRISISNNANVTMKPGLYYLNGPSTPGSYGGLYQSGQSGGINMDTNSTLTGTGVVIYNGSGDNLNFYNAKSVTLYPPTSGIYDGVSIWQPRNDPMEIHLVSSNTFTVQGTLYAATGLFDLRPMGSSVFNMGNYVCWQFETNQAGTDFGVGGGTTGTTNLNPSKAAPTQRSIQLVE